MNQSEFCYDNCKHLSPTEKEQDAFYKEYGDRQKHLCKYGDLFHEIYHPKILRHPDCDYMNEEDLNGFNTFLLNIINTIERQYNPESKGLREPLKQRYFEKKSNEEKINE